MKATDEINKDANLKSLSFSSLDFFFDTKKAFVQSFSFNEQVRFFPTFFMNIQVQDPKIVKDIYRATHYRVSCNTKEIYLKTDLYVSKIEVISSDTFQLHGYCCSPNFVEKYETKYLGDTQTRIFRSLGSGKSLYTNSNIVSKFWQINSNGINTLMNFCNSFSDYEFWSITLSHVNLSAKTKLHEYFPLNEVDDIVIYPKVSKSVTSGSGNVFTSIGLYPHLFSKEQSSVSKLYAKNLTAKDIARPSLILNGKYFFSYPLKCGDRMQSSSGDEISVKYWEVHSCSYFFSEHNCVCRMQLSGF